MFSVNNQFQLLVPIVFNSFYGLKLFSFLIYLFCYGRAKKNTCCLFDNWQFFPKCCPIDNFIPACIRLNQSYKSAVAAHVLIDGHTNVNKDSLKLKKQVNDCRRLDAYEAYYIQSNTNLLNCDRGNIESPLFAKIQ